MSDTAPDIAEIYARMRQAAAQLRRTSIAERVEVMHGLRDHIVAERERVIESLMVECGKTRTDANIEFLGALDWLRWLEDNAAKFLADEKVATPLLLMGKKSKIIHEPLGVVLIIAPWNYPFHIGITQIFTAFAAGNAVVYKPSELTPMRGIYEAMLEPFPMIRDAVSIVYGNGETGRALIDGLPEKIFFTGSTRTGKAISKQAADYLIPVDLELGGKDPMIVFAGANLDRAVAAAVWGAFTHNGQSCSAVERVYVEESIHDEFVRRAKAETEKLIQKTGDSDGNADIGRITVKFQMDKVIDHVEDARAQGATVETGGRVLDADKLLYAPTVLSRVNHNMKAVMEETFGPVLPIMPFKTEEEAIRLANDSPYGLQGSVFSADLAQCERVARALEVGGVSINNVNMVEGNPWLSFGGRKQTGSGRARGVEGLYAFTRSKHILADPNSGKIEANWYPYTPGKYRLLLDLIRDNFARTPWRLVKLALTGLSLEKESQKRR